MSDQLKTNDSRMTLSFVEKAKLWLDISTLVFIGLSAVAGMLALYFGTKLEEYRGRERDRLKTDIASSNARIAEANEKAEKAKEGTAKALLDAAAANERSKDFDLKLEKQRELTAKAEERATNAELRSDSAMGMSSRAEKGTKALQEKEKPRHLTIEQSQKLLGALKLHQIGMPIEVSYWSGNGESKNFAEQIGEVLIKAGYNVTGFHPELAWLWAGVFLVERSRETSSDRVVSELQNAFASIGVSLKPRLNSTLPKEAEGKIIIYVGSKP